MQIFFQQVKTSASDLHGPDSPAVGALITDAGKQRDTVLGSGGQQGVVRFADLVHAGDGVGAGAQLGGQGDGVAHIQVVDTSKDTIRTPVVTGDGAVSVPNAGVLKVARPFCQDGAGGALVDLDVHVQAGDFQGGEVAAAVIEVGRDLRIAGGWGGRTGSGRGAPGRRAAKGDAAKVRRGHGDPGAAVDNGTLAHHIAGGQIGGQRGAGVQGVGAGRAEGGRDQGRVLAHVHVEHLAPVSRNHRLDGGGRAVLRVAGAVDVIFQGAGGDGQGQRQAQQGKKSGQFLHVPLPPAFDEVERSAAQQHHHDNGHNGQYIVLFGGGGVLPGGVGRFNGSGGVCGVGQAGVGSVAGFLRGDGFQGRALEDRHIADFIQVDTAHRARIVGGDGVALDVAAGGGAGVGRHGSEVAVPLGLPVDGLEGQGVAVVLDGLRDILRVLVGKAGIGAGGGQALGGAAIPSHLHVHRVQFQGQHPGQAILGDELLCLREKGQHRAHVLALAGHRHRFRVLAALVGGEFLFQQIGQGIVVALLLKVGTGDASGVVLRPQVVHLPDLAPVLAPGDGGGVAGGRLGGFRRVGGKGGGGQAHGESQNAQQPGRIGDGFPLH